MSLFPLNQGAGPSGFGYRSTAEAVTLGLDLSGKTYLVTGCSTGLGRETLRVLTLRGACVIALARTLENARKVCAQVAGDTVPLACELSDPGSINRAIDEVRSGDHRLDGIIANAGIMALPKLQQKFDLELQFLTNHVGHFILVTGLIDQLTDHGRVVMLSSVAHKRTYHDGIQFNNLSGEKIYVPWHAYGQSKLCNLLFARHLSTRLPGSGQTANAVHPGVIATRLTRHMNPLLRVSARVVAPVCLKNVAQGAATQCYVATHPAVAGMTGRYFADSNEAIPSRFGQDDALASVLWARTEDIVSYLD